MTGDDATRHGVAAIAGRFLSRGSLLSAEARRDFIRVGGADLRSVHGCGNDGGIIEHNQSTNRGETMTGDDMPDPRKLAARLACQPYSPVLDKELYNKFAKLAESELRELMARCYLHAASVVEKYGNDIGSQYVEMIRADLLRLAAEIGRGQS